MKLIWLWLLAIPAFAQTQTTYSWYDGDTERKVYVDPNWMARIEYPKAAKQAPRVTFIRVSTAKAKQNLNPVFRNSKTTGNRMVLPGNILVRFTKDMDPSMVKEWATSKNSEIVEKIRYEPNTYILTSPSGIAAIELANRVRGDEGITAAEPIWWSETAKK